MFSAFRTHTARILIACAASIALAASAVGVFYGTQTAYAVPSAAQKQAEAQAVLVRLNAMQDQLDRASTNYNEALIEQGKAEKSRDAAQAKIQQLSKEINSVQGRLNDRARSMYRGGPASVLDLLLGSTSFKQFTLNWEMITRINESDAALIQRSKDLRAQAEEQHKVFNEQATLAKTKADEAKVIADQAKKTVNEMQVTYDNLSAEAKNLLAQEEAARAAAQQEAANREIERQRRMAPREHNNASNGAHGGGSAASRGGSSRPAPQYSASSGNVIIDRARAQLGKPYVWGAIGPSSFDCSGLVGYAVTGRIGRIGTARSFMGWPRVYDPKPGDIAVNSHHCGVYIGGGRMIHAATERVGVIEGPVQAGMIFVRPN